MPPPDSSARARGLHHVTLITRRVQANVDFYAGFLGLHLVKQTAGYEDAEQLHLFYGDAAGAPVGLTFVPHLTPMIRGIHATLYGRLTGEPGDFQALFEQRFADEPFVDVMPPGSHPETRSVKGANLCRIAVHRPGNGDTVVVLAVIDNLVKGASGQAIQNLNLMFGFRENAGLEAPALMP